MATISLPKIFSNILIANFLESASLRPAPSKIPSSKKLGSFFHPLGTYPPIFLSIAYMQEERFWLLASLKLSGEANSEEQAELNELLSQYPEMTLRLEIFTNIWRQQHPEGSIKKEDAFNKHLQRLSTHLSAPVLRYESVPSPSGQERSAEHPPAPTDQPAPPRLPISGRPLRKRWIAITAAAAACIAIAFFLYPPGGNKPGSALTANTVSTRPGSKSKIQLPDGTQVWLNADSRLTYNAGFNGSTREVQLTGEAYFDVVKDKSHPFLIHTASVDIRVLGTVFNVRSYTNERNTETALFQGSVEVTPHNSPDKKIILQPNEKLTVRNNQVSVTASPAGVDKNSPDEPMMTLGKVHFQKKDSSITETLWTKNQLAFDGASLEEVGWQIERWYAVKVNIGDQRLRNIHITAVFEDESLPQVMEALRMTGNFTYTIHKKEVTIAPRP
jgi:transmembrane sensor